MPIQPTIEDSLAAKAPPVRGDARRVAIASAIGTTIEWYDFFIYGTAAATVFAPRFFPQVSPVAGTLAAFARTSVLSEMPSRCATSAVLSGPVSMLSSA